MTRPITYEPSTYLRLIDQALHSLPCQVHREALLLHLRNFEVLQWDGMSGFKDNVAPHYTLQAPQLASRGPCLTRDAPHAAAAAVVVRDVHDGAEDLDRADDQGDKI